MPAPELVQAVVDSATRYERDRAGQQVGALIDFIRREEKLDEALALKALYPLQANRWFDLLQPLADALIQSEQDSFTVRKLYGQALIEQGAISAAIPFLEKLMDDCPDDLPDDAEAHGLVGRAYKQSYVNGHGLSPTRRERLMRKAIEHYDAGTWRGINAVALRARAARDGIAGFSPANDVAEETLATAVASGDHWSYATAAEACIALGRWKEALEWLDRYLAHPLTDAFAVGSTLRQFTEVWQLASLGYEGAAILEVLRAGLLRRGGGARIDHAGGDESCEADSMLQLVLGADRYRTLEWYRTGLDRSRAVARLGRETSKGLGTGFLVHERDLDPAAGDGWLLITNAHVLSPDYRNALRAEKAVVTFEALDGGAQTYRIGEILWSSLPDKLDATIARLDRNPDGVTPIPVATSLPERDENARLYVIGHPLGGTLSFSIDDNLLIDYDDPRVHYRSPTDPGSSGSPVFDCDWSLVALHHAGSRTMTRLHGEGGTYEANEGLYIGAIAKAFRERPH